MKLYLVSRTDHVGYDNYDSIVVIAESEKAARNTLPSAHARWGMDLPEPEYGSWAMTPESLDVVYLGEAVEGAEPRVVLASYNAG